MGMPEQMLIFVHSSGYGVINTPGFNLHDASVLNAPYSAYVIGDYTGITQPF